MSATIDGSDWKAVALDARRLASGVIVTGADGVRAVSLSFVPPATGGQTTGPINLIVGLVMFGTETWQTNSSGMASGTVSLTTFRASRVVGTFSFTGLRIQGATPVSRKVTNRRFDVRF